MGQPQKIPEAECRRLWLADVPLRAIARRFGVDPSSVRRFARARQWPHRATERPGPIMRWNPDEARELWQDRSITVRQIAQRLGTTVETLREYGRSHGWQPRGPSPITNDAPTTQPTHDDDIARYRAEKLRKVARDEMQLADARRLFKLLERAYAPKRGRPRKTQERAA